MKLIIEIISKEMIKPSTPTPSHLRNHKVSFLDQTAPPSFIPIIFFYNASFNINPFEKSHHLKKSLAQTLTFFYPLAAGIMDETLDQSYFITCNDNGVLYNEAQVSCKLSQVVENPKMEFLHELLPFTPTSDAKVRVGVQYNVFQCGGIAISLCITHKLVDGTSASEFVKSWAALCKGGDANIVKIQPSFLATSLFPPQQIPSFHYKGAIVEHKTVTKRLLFTRSDIAALRDIESVGHKGEPRLLLPKQPPTRVEAISAFIWRKFIEIARSNPKKTTKHFAAIQAVNLRPRMNEPLPSQAFGNVWWFAIATTPNEEKEKDNKYLANQIRNSIQEIDSEYVKKLQDTMKLMEMKKHVAQRMYSGEIEFCSFTSWCRFPLYEEGDFGWGKPCWVCSPSEPYKNTVVLMSASDGEGIEAWINLPEDDVVLFERDPELFPFAS